ncbi:hypothetical protein BBJ28_00022041, partial [Nothophytophthora sp. Chile5]
SSSVISGPYRVGNTDGDTCSYHALQSGASCREPRTCYECLNTDVSGASGGCLLAPSGFCEDMSSYEVNLDYRRNTTGEDLDLTGWYNYFPSINSTYCEPSDAACDLCDELVTNGSLGHSSYNSSNVSTEVERQFCLGTDGCVCLMACETANWESNMPAECEATGGSSSADNSSGDVSSYSTMLVFYLVLQVSLLGVFMYRRGLCMRFFERRRPARGEGPYNNVDAITSPSNRLRLSGWRAMQKTLIEREKKQQTPQHPQYIESPRIDNSASEPVEDDAVREQELATSSRNSDSARASYRQVDDEMDATGGRHRSSSSSSVEEAKVHVTVVTSAVSNERRSDGESEAEAAASSSSVRLEAHRDVV